MPKEKQAVEEFVDIIVLEASCQAFHQTILCLPRDAVRDRLFISVLKVREHLHRRHFSLVERALVSMRALIGGSAEHATALSSLQRFQNQLAQSCEIPYRLVSF